MLAAGVAFIGDVQHADGMSWQHFRCPDGTIAEITGPGAASPEAIVRTDIRAKRERRIDASGRLAPLLSS